MNKIEYLAFGFSMGSQCGVVAECLGSLEDDIFKSVIIRPILILVIVKSVIINPS